MREIREEIGIDDVSIVQPLGQTVHGNVDGRTYAVKTTHWFEMATPEEHFRPQREEDIEAVKWMSWTEAQRVVGFDSLRRHLESVRPLVTA